MKESALIVVDMLYDFIDGSLACQNAEEAVENTIAFIRKMNGGQACDEVEISAAYPVLFICDHHPANHSSFKEYGGIWPVHCVAGTKGGAIHDKLLPAVNEELCFYKGCDKAVEQYSGFAGVNKAGQSLAEILELMDINEVYVCGIATEFCVRNTAEDLLKAGFKVSILRNAIAYVDKEGHEKALAEMAAEGIGIE